VSAPSRSSSPSPHRYVPWCRSVARTALLKSECALDAPEQEPDAHQEERSQVVAGEPGSSCEFPAGSPQRGQPRAQAQVSGAVVSEAGQQIALLHHEHPALALRSAAHVPPGEVQMQGAHHVDAGVVFGDPELSTNPRGEVEQTCTRPAQVQAIVEIMISR
jgi:hypothetical protein